jgi:hypothetical protein
LTPQIGEALIVEISRRVYKTSSIEFGMQTVAVERNLKVFQNQFQPFRGRRSRREKISESQP